ncbi:WXG100 family type VII secretion target [Couchioplanes azureus]|uniref:WXG100 family type VII secretion target n=1 Tax=Couchioplanes caeruleus TaxID=56438 RepID=UPI00166FDA3D|nr:hypothetical protein [Couchioplanes caeruleus]GGQ44571.1 hypothetical protein GCM10010166_11400 [Couchioplanes caeruleus subsp. azureus]
MTDTAAPNPLIAARQDSTQWYSGLGLVESVADTVNGIESGSWIDSTIGGVATGLDALATVLDPLGSLVSWGVGWLLEHVKPLSDALDWLAGDPDQITAYAQTWRNVAANTTEVAATLQTAVTAQLGEWAGASARAYRAHITEQLTAMDGIARATAGIAALVEGAGLLVALVRELVRDLIADFVSVLAVRLPMWLAEEGATLGLATPLVVSQVGSLVAKWAARIGKLISALISSLRRLTPLLKRLGDLIDELSDLLRRLARTGEARTPTAGTAGRPGAGSEPAGGDMPTRPTPQGGTPAPSAGLPSDGPALAGAADQPRLAEPDAPAQRSPTGAEQPGGAIPVGGPSGPDAAGNTRRFPSGAGWVEDADSPRAAEVYRRARDSTDAAPRIAGNTGIRSDVIGRVQQHLFRTEHDVQLGPNQTARGYFTPLDEIADLWTAAENGTLDADGLHRFRRLVAHEYVESRLMEAGLPYRSANPDAYADDYYWPSPEHHGAHDLAPIAGAAGGPFDHWPRRLGRDVPDVEIADDLSNLDDIVELALRDWNR